VSEPLYSHEEFNAKVWQVMRALMAPEDNRVDAELCLDALAFVAAVIFNMDPHVATPRDLRVAAEQHGGVTFRYLKWLRTQFERTGIHFGDRIGGEAHGASDVPLGHARH
jgi:hypothetical protein